MGRSTVCSILKETCEAIWTVLQPQCVRAPSTNEEWVGVSREFEKLWNFPNCIGSLVRGLHKIFNVNNELFI